MGEVSDQTESKEEEIELDLGLSIGGSSFRKSEKSKINGVENHTTALLRSSTLSPLPIVSSEPESVLFDPQSTKLEIQALRRQEVKRKREDKKSRGGGRNECSQIKEEEEEEQQQQQQQPASKKVRIDANVNLNLSNGQKKQHLFAVQPVHYPFPPAQLVPYTNGFAYPCVMPCWAPAGGGGFRPFQPQPDSVVDPSINNGSDSDHQNAGFRKTTSLNGSPMCSSSTVSDHYSGSHEGGGSSDTRSHSSQCLPEQNHLSGNSKAKDHTVTSHTFESNSQAINGDHKVVPKEEPISSEAKPVPIPKPISPEKDTTPTPTPTPTTPLKEISKVDIPKPPKPQTQSPNPPSVPEMPYVSTTGNGPNGKTIHGFLYRYSKSEISIVCVCHGSTFSPAEFVQHAGGTDVSQPLRHITVIPSAFGG